VFVEPQAWSSFQKTGNWPDGTMFVLEIRYSQSHGSINNGGHFQTDISAVEMAVKDSARNSEDKWSYYDFRAVGGKAAESAKPLPKTAGCFACHSTNGAVDNTFTQFYPTALEIAQAKGTVRASFHPWTPSPAKLYHVVKTDGWQKGQPVLEQAVAEEPTAAILQEPILNALGYQLLEAKRTSDAIEVFRYASTRYPKSANALDSLAEALEGAGDTDAAVIASRRVLDLLQGDTSTPERRRIALEKAARERVARLGKP